MMNQVIGDILPAAVGIAISPLPIIAMILMLMSPRARTTVTGFCLGWLLGIVITATVFTLLSNLLPEEDDSAKPVVGVIQLLLGLVLFALAVSKWRGRPQPGDEPSLPNWMQAINSMKFAAALGLGALLSAVNPKNLVMSAAAGLAIGSAGLQIGATTASIAIFVALAGATVLVPYIGFLVAADALRAPLERLRKWLVSENATIMSILLLVLAVSSIGKGIGSF